MRMPVGSTSTGPTRNDGDRRSSASWNQSRASASALRGAMPLVTWTLPPGFISNVSRTVWPGRIVTSVRPAVYGCSSGRIEISEAESDAAANAVVSGSQDAWVRALGPGGSSDELSFNGNRGLADQVLSGFTAAAARRAAA